jgi:uracil phosphoribosyltransferase
MAQQFPNLTLLPQTTQLRALLTVIRDRETTTKEFVNKSDRIIRLLIEESMNFLTFRKKVIVAPTSKEYDGVECTDKLCGVSIMRAGESMEKCLREVIPDLPIGKILIQRNESDFQPKLYYTKLPHNIKECKVFLVDPMLATAGSACKAIAILKDHGIKEENIIFINLVAAPEGVKKC